jgi:hypothetical protein
VAVGGGEVEDVAVGVADGEVGVDEAGGEAEGWGVEFGGGLGGGGWGWGVGGGGFLGVEGRGGEKRGEKEGGWGETHGDIRVSSCGPARTARGFARRGRSLLGVNREGVGVRLASAPTHDEKMS